MTRKEALLPWTAIAPKSYQALAATSATLASSPLGRVLIELVQTRVSQINGCAFCLDMHVRDLRKAGEGWQRINSLPTWRECGFYSERERAALGWAEALTKVSNGHAGLEEAFEALKPHFSDAEIVDLGWVVATINAWNRMAIGMGNPVAEKPLE